MKNQRNKMTKQFTQFMLLCGIVCSMVFLSGITAKAETVTIECGVGVIGTLDEGTGTLTISGNGKIADYEENYSASPFYDNDKIYKIVINDSITEIGNYVFYKLVNLQSITFGKNITRIGNGAFKSCSGLYNIDIPATVTTIGKEAFYKSGLKQCTLHEGLKTIGEGAFLGTNLTTIAIPENVESIETNAFPTVKAVTIPKNITIIKADAFGTVDATIYSMTVTIGEGAFGYNSSLTAEHGSTADTYAKNHSSITIKYFPHDYTISFNANGGSVALTSKVVSSEGLYNELPNPVRAGYKFSGWYKKAVGGKKVLATSKVNISKDTTLYAHWSYITVDKCQKPAVSAKKGKKASVSFAAVKGAKGYQIRYSTKANMKKAKQVSSKKRVRTITKLKAKKYYVQVRAYKIDSAGRKVYGAWSKKSSVKIKKAGK